MGMQAAENVGGKGMGNGSPMEIASTEERP